VAFCEKRACLHIGFCTMPNNLEEWEKAREKAFTILCDNNFYHIFNDFFEACNGYIHETDVPGGNRFSNQVHPRGENFIRFLKKSGLVKDFTVNGSSSNGTCSHKIAFEENFDCFFIHESLSKKINISIEDLNYKWNWYSGTFNFKIDDVLVFSGECSTIDTGTGRGKIILKEDFSDIKSVKLSRDWIFGILPALSNVFSEARHSNNVFEQKKLEKQRKKEFKGSFDIGDFE
jgi:hypothetical protein